MSWLSKKIPKSVKKIVSKFSYVVPGLSTMLPIGGKEQLMNSVKGLATGAVIATGMQAGTGLASSIKSGKILTSVAEAKKAFSAVKSINSSIKTVGSIAKSVKGTKAPVNQMTVKPTPQPIVNENRPRSIMEDLGALFAFFKRLFTGA